ncbi:glycoside hydrolase family 3 protein [Erythrobacter sp. F6033]|uniref:glycoside hydrolase family 3 protein n=1 Tax=Erythrobacter sp. F6033 TaxID=2926401 RepID=UPI001FF4A3F3|nr:glycoside hydrolase family 3 protein [Erythrobacter sp. F6033]MCK0127376.1 exo 1,3/1,4-beta-D-glucan glucohydrolase [Erythrobacter sp. F6033]
MRISARLMAASALATLVSACGAGAPVQTATSAAPVGSVPAAGAQEQQIIDLIAQMSLERKVAQLIQPDIASITPADVEKYRFGSVLNGGNSGPYNNDFAPAEDWLKLADEFWEASTKPLANGEPAIPTIWGTDAVHGHANVIGATIFPHNIALGATGEPDLIRRIGAATATEIEVTGIDWTFAPTVAVARDDRWGRTYESYSEDPALVAQMGVAMVEGLQGKPGDEDFLGKGRVIATAKHFFGDGGTAQGVDQGEVNGDIEDLKRIHVAPYPPAIDAGLGSVMASFNSINGKKMHGNKALLTDLLRDEMGFDGLVVGDWNGHGQIKGCTNTDCPQAMLAGLDVYMVPEDWKGLYETTLSQVKDGTIPEARIDQAVARVLRIKQRAGILDGEVKPSMRPNGGDWSKLGSAEHRAIAREAVAKSMVLLKNNGVLPIKANANIMVAGTAADSIAQQAGGWTITWQGGGELTNKDFPGATSILAGIQDAAKSSGGSVDFSLYGVLAEGQQPDLGIVVFGEEPYAEFVGDRKDLAFRDEEGLKVLRTLKAAGVPTVAVFLSGRPMWVNRELNVADAFVAAWLPGSEGAGVADFLYGKAGASGALSFSWPVSCEGNPLNGPEGALFPVGFSRSMDNTTPFGALSEDCSALDGGGGSDWFTAGRLAERVKALSKGTELPDLRGKAGGIVARGIDRNTQEDARQIDFGPGTALDLSGPQGGNAYRITYQVLQRPSGKVELASNGGTFDVSRELLIAEGKGWREMVITEACLAGINNGLTIRSEAPFSIQISAIAQETAADGAECSF